MEGTSGTVSRSKYKHASTLSCMIIEKPVRNRRQRKSLEDITNINRQQHRSQEPDESWIEQFTFEMEIGQGAFGSVWRVRDKKGRSRALKVMHKDKY